MPASVSRSTAATTWGWSGALRTTPWEPRRAMPSSVATSSGIGGASARWNRARNVAGRTSGSCDSSAARTAAETWPGASTTRSRKKVRPVSRNWERCRCRSAIARCTSSTVLCRTPPRWLRTRSTVASDNPAWRRSRGRNTDAARPKSDGPVDGGARLFARRGPVRLGRLTPLRKDAAMTTLASARTTPGWFTADDCRLEDFRAVVEVTTDLADYPHADEVRENVLVYGPGLREHTATAAGRREVQAELARALADGPGIVVLAGAFPDTGVVDRATAVFEAMIAEQKAAGVVGGDHFALPGANDRVWGALDKFAVRDPEAFAAYYGNDAIALVSEAWLGRGYQVTSQVNVVNPGGKAQVAHRDYPLGFMSEEQALAYPAHVHRLSPVMTLQGAVAHCDMPVETGPTMYLPHSQKYAPGYVAFHQPEFTAYFDAHFVQLPLRTGDAAFFNPALFHGAGTNRSADVRRMANLLQVSSAFGRAMETVERTAMVRALYPALLALRDGGADQRTLRNVDAASAEGYAFPTNLNRDQPIGGLAPEAQAELVWRALQAGWPLEALDAELTAQAERHTSAL